MGSGCGVLPGGVGCAGLAKQLGIVPVSHPIILFFQFTYSFVDSQVATSIPTVKLSKDLITLEPRDHKLATGHYWCTAGRELHLQQLSGPTVEAVFDPLQNGIGGSRGGLFPVSLAYSKTFKAPLLSCHCLHPERLHPTAGCTTVMGKVTWESRSHCWQGTLDKASALQCFFPGLWTIEKLYSCGCSSHLAIWPLGS